jgi:prepilin-type N-terminal cleavage/methylation domain-containing protein
MRIRRDKTSGFTLIEILIVIVLLGILAVAVLSAINPLEQVRKARDSARKSDAAELLNAYERYYTTFGCYPWNNTACDTPPTIERTTAENPDFSTAGTEDEPLMSNNELKTNFETRDSVVNGWLWTSEDSPGGLVSVCFEPESSSARNSGLGPLRDITNTATATCTGSYSGGGATASCFVCLPQ